MSTFHKDQGPEDSHGPGYFQTAEPADTRPGVMWTDPDTGVVKQRNEAGDDWILVGRQAEAQADSTASDTAEMVTDFNALLAKLRTAGILVT